MKHWTKAAVPKVLLVILISMISVRCSIQPKIEGEFGTARAPNSHQIAEIKLKNGETLLARKIQQEHDSILTVLLDYSTREIAVDSVQFIEVRQRTARESADKKGHKMSEDGKKKAAYMGFGCAQVFKNTVDEMKP